MRFNPSQTTPSSRAQRSQLRMLSYVGLSSLVAITVGLTIVRAPDEHAVQLSKTDSSSAQDGNSKIPPVTVVASPARDGTIELSTTRAQTGDPQIQLVADSTGLFKRRGHENADEGEMFLPRPHRSDRNNGDVFEDNAVLDDTLKKTHPPRDDRRPTDEETAIPLNPNQVIDQTSPFDESEGVSDLVFHKKTEVEKREPSRRATPTFDERDLDADEFIRRPESTPPSSKKIFEDERVDLTQPTDLLEDVVPSRTPTRQRPPVAVEDPVPDPIEPFSNETSRSLPMEQPRHTEPPRHRDRSREEDLNRDDLTREVLPRREDLFMDEQPHRKPFREERASVEIDKSYLDLVRDNDLGIRKSESKAFYWLLDHARRVSLREFQQAGLKDVQYINLISQPDQFRGEPITIEGDLWKLYEFEAGANDYNVDRLYEAWIFTGDSGHNPYRVVCTSLGKGIEPGEHLRVPVRLTGYFFKREAYPSKGGSHIAPTLLARRISINPSPNGIPQLAGVVPYTLGGLMAIGLALLVTFVSFAVNDERSIRSGLSRWRREPQLSFAGVTLASPRSVEQSLRDYAESQRQAAISGAYGPLLSRQTALEHGVRPYFGSRPTMVDDGTSRTQRQSSVLQDWAARQKEAHSVSDTYVGSASASTTETVFDDELRSDRLAPARHPLHRPETWTEPRKSISTPASPAASYPVQQRPRQELSRPEPSTGVSSEHRTYETRQTPPVSSPSHGGAISYGASKLSEYEEEIAKMTNRHSTTRVDSHSLSRSTDLSAEDQIERDRVIRESEIRERMQRQHAETDRARLEQFDRDRIERERLELDRLNRETLEQAPRHRIDDSTADRSDDSRSDAIGEYTDYDYDESVETEAQPGNDVETQQPKKRGGGWGWPRRRDNAGKAQAADQSDQSTSDTTDDDSRSSGWGRRRKRHKR